MARRTTRKSEARFALGRYLKSRRELAGLTQAEIAKITGNSFAQIVSNWERGVIPLPFPTVKRLVKILKLDCEVVANLYVGHTEIMIESAFKKKFKSFISNLNEAKM